MQIRLVFLPWWPTSNSIQKYFGPQVTLSFSLSLSLIPLLFSPLLIAFPSAPLSFPFVKKSTQPFKNLRFVGQFWEDLYCWATPDVCCLSIHAPVVFRSVFSNLSWTSRASALRPVLTAFFVISGSSPRSNYKAVVSSERVRDFKDKSLICKQNKGQRLKESFEYRTFLEKKKWLCLPVFSCRHSFHHLVTHPVIHSLLHKFIHSP